MLEGSFVVRLPRFRTWLTQLGMSHEACDFQAEMGADRSGPKSDQTSHLMAGARIPRFNHQGGLQTHAFPVERGHHSPKTQQTWNGELRGICLPIAQNENGASPDRLRYSQIRYPPERGTQCCTASIGSKGTIDLAGLGAQVLGSVLLQLTNGLHLLQTEHRRLKFQNLGRWQKFLGCKDVGTLPQVGSEIGYQALSQIVERRIGNLGKILREIVK